MMIGLKPRDEWRFRTRPELLDDLAAQLRERFPTTHFNFTQPIIDSVTEDASGTSADLGVVISGADFSTLETLGVQIAAVLRTVPGAVDVSVEEEEPQSQLIIESDRAHVARYNVHIEAVNRLINTAIGGEPIGTLYDGDRRFNIAVRFDPQLLRSIETIDQLPAFSESGTPIPLASLATFEHADGQTLIKSEGGQRHHGAAATSPGGIRPDSWLQPASESPPKSNFRTVIAFAGSACSRISRGSLASFLSRSW